MRESLSEKNETVAQYACSEGCRQTEETVDYFDHPMSSNDRWSGSLNASYTDSSLYVSRQAEMTLEA